MTGFGTILPFQSALSNGTSCQELTFGVRPSASAATTGAPIAECHVGSSEGKLAAALPARRHGESPPVPYC